MISGYQTWPWATPNGEIASCTHRAGEESRITPLTLTLPKFEYGSCCTPYASAFKTIYLASRSTSERFKILPPTESRTIIYTGLNTSRSPSASWSWLTLSCQPFEGYKRARPVAILPASSSPILSRMKAKHDPSPPSQLLICREKNLAVPRQQGLTDVNMLPNTLLPASSLTGTQNVDPDQKDTREPSEPGIIFRSGVQPERELVH